MAKKCNYCNYMMGDQEVYCPSCGKKYQNPDEAVTVSADVAPAAPPVNPVVSQTPPALVSPAAATKQKSRVPFILLGVGIAAVLFVVLLVIILNTGKTKTQTTASSSQSDTTVALEGKYTWTSPGDNQSGSMRIYDDDTALFTRNDSTSIYMTFDKSSNTVSFTDSDGTKYTGTYSQDGDNLYITFDNYTDSFKKD